MLPHFSGATYASNVNGAQQSNNFTQPCTPFNLQTMPWPLATTIAPQPGGIMQFGTSQKFESNRTAEQTKLLHKRKSELQCSLPQKQLITEERIAAHFNSMHISGDYQNHMYGGATNSKAPIIQGGLPSDDTPSTSKGKTDGGNPAFEFAAQNLEKQLRNASRIVLCDQLKTLDSVHQNNNTIPEIVLRSVPRPCTALIPWQPPIINTESIKCELTGIKKKEQEQRGKIILSEEELAELPDLPDDYSDIDFEDDVAENNNINAMNFNEKTEEMDEDL